MKKSYADHFSPDEFLRKASAVASKLGRQALKTGFTLFYCLQDEDTPTWVRTVIIGALGYFILPIDAIPDFLPGAGLVDDMATIAGALATATSHVKLEHRHKAAEMVKSLLGDDSRDDGDPVVVDID